MTNNFVLFLGLILLVFISSISFIQQAFLLAILFFLGLIFNVSVLKIISKIKFFLISLIIIYSIAIPGEILFFYYFISISYDGMYQAAYNAMRLINIFSIVALMMYFLPREYLIRNIIKFSEIFSIIGFNKDRLSSRLFLTFEYFELLKDFKFKFKTFTYDLQKILSKNYRSKIKINPQSVQLKRIDLVCILIFILSVLIIRQVL